MLARSVQLARQAREEAGLSPDEAWVAASVGPYGAARADGSEYTGEYGLDVVAAARVASAAPARARRRRARRDRGRDGAVARGARGGVPRTRGARHPRVGQRHDRRRSSALGRLARRGVRACGSVPECRRGRRELLRRGRGERRAREPVADRPARGRLPEQRRGRGTPMPASGRARHPRSPRTRATGSTAVRASSADAVAWRPIRSPRSRGRSVRCPRSPLALAAPRSVETNRPGGSHVPHPDHRRSRQGRAAARAAARRAAATTSRASSATRRTPPTSPATGATPVVGGCRGPRRSLSWRPCSPDTTRSSGRRAPAAAAPRARTRSTATPRSARWMPRPRPACDAT